MSLVIAAGGTGGHVFPALAVAEAWRKRWPHEPLYWIGVKGGREQTWVQEAGIPFYGIHAAGWQPHASWRNLRLAYKLPQAAWETFGLFRRLRPRILFTTGGYPGLLPGYWAAALGIPLAVLELNRHAGRTVRWLSRVARKVYGAFPETQGLPSTQAAEWVGVPVRFSSADRTRHTPESAKAAWGLPPDQPLILVLGGSQGSSSLNQAVYAALPSWHHAGASVLWQVGRQGFTHLPPHVRIEPFLKDMVAAYQAADVVVSRAGGSTLGELAWWGKASVLLPSPHVAEDHQRKNALYWAEQKAAIVVSETEPKTLSDAVLQLLASPETRKQYQQAAHQLSQTDAAEKLAEQLYSLGYGLSD